MANKSRQKRISAAVLALFLLAGPPVCTAQSIRLDRVEIAGNRRVDAEAVRVRLRTRAGQAFDEATVDADVRAIYAMGFFDNIEVDLSNVAGKNVLTYHLFERPFIRSVRVEGNNKLDDDELEAVLLVKPNTIFDPERARKGIAEARKLYEKKGYLDVKIEVKTEPVDNDRAIVTFVVHEGNPVRIRRLSFEGNRAFDQGKLSSVMETRQEWFLSFLTGRGTLDREVLKTDVERLTAFYYDHGYIDVRIDDPIIKRDEQGLVVTIKIDEGNVYRFGSVKIDGDVLPQAEGAREYLAAKTDDTFQPSRLREDINLLTTIYGDLGYAFVNITPDTDVHPTVRRVDVTYRIDKGPEVYIDRIEITGNTKTRDKVIRRELALQEQQLFVGSRLRRSQQRLRRLGYFQDVNITTRKTDRKDRLDLLVDVKEGSTGSFAAGAGISSGESFLFNLRLSEINLFGRGQRVVANADFGSLTRNISLSFTEPYFFDSELSLGVDIFNWRLIFDQFTRGGTGAGIRLLYPFSALGWNRLWGMSLIDTRFGLEYRIENASVTDVSSTAASVIVAEQITSLTSSVTPRIFRDTRNHPFDPTSGSLQDFSFQLAGLGGDSRFIKAESRARWYYPIWKSPRFGIFTVSTGWTFGYGLGYGGKRELPLFERYFPGGINSIRGYSVRSLGPRVDVFGQSAESGSCSGNLKKCRARRLRRDEIGGSQQLIFNNEFIFPIVQGLGLKGVLFFDAGDAFTASQGITFGDMRMAAGFGVRWLSPMGPLRIEIGFPLNPRVGDDTQAISFSFGGPP